MTTKFKVGDLVQGKSTRKIYRVITWEEYNKAQMALKSFVLRLTPEADRTKTTISKQPHQNY